MSATPSTTLNTKQHFSILDGLRGIAAIGIVIFHFMEWMYTDFSLNFIGHGFLAVDFFFCLSGFVIAYAYDDRLAKMGILEFFKRRLIRLHPLVILGSVLGLLGFLLDPYVDNLASYNLPQIALLFVTSILLIPNPTMADRSFNVFGLNAPSWSLFWEYMANICYALVLVRLNKRVIYVLTLLAAIVLGKIAYQTGNLLGGWSADNFWHGGARISYSFLMGMLIFRNRWIIRNKLGFVGLTILLLAALMMPYFAENWLVELLIVLCYFPLLVSLGAGATLSPRLAKVCDLSGRISYPLYMTHYFAIWIFGNFFLANKPEPRDLTGVIILATIGLLFIAYLAMRFYDEPIRKYLSKRTVKK
ncbi:acyltransferase family protein [Parapedobacter sp. DT-150]|uniref:acyltransferase family protein n=1 Tax=Parapedobacter sp. DT-150 TaxID=3396162 RepID=UPI003F1D034C